MSRFIKPVIAAATVSAMAGSLLVGPGAAGAKSASAKSHATSVPAVVTCAHKREVRPRGEFVLACGDGNALLAKTVWSSWGTKRAVGVADFELNSCQPTCVAGKTVDYRGAKVVLSDVVKTKHGLDFGVATVTYRSHGKTHTFVQDLIS